MPISRERKHTHHQCPIKSLLILHEALKSYPILFSFMVQPKFLDILFNFVIKDCMPFISPSVPFPQCNSSTFFPEPRVVLSSDIYHFRQRHPGRGPLVSHCLSSCFFGGRLSSIYMERKFSFKWKTSLIRVQRREAEFLKIHLPKNVFIFYITSDSLYFMEFWEHKFSNVNHWFLDFWHLALLEFSDLA